MPDTSANTLPVIAHLPCIAGEGLLFAYSGLDGPTHEAFVATLLPNMDGLLLHTPQQRVLRFRLPTPRRALIATNDVLHIDIPGTADFLATFVSAHTLIGRTPRGTQPSLALKGAAAPIQNPSISATDSDAFVLLTSGNRFALSYAPNAHEALNRAKAGLRANLYPAVRDRLAPLVALPPHPEPRFDRLLKKCLSVMRVNTLAPCDFFAQHWSTPDRVPHQGCWLWDSAFHSLAMNHVDPRLSWYFLKSVLDTQRADGLIPHHTSPDGKSSSITQPPLLAWAVWENYQRTRDRAALAWALPRLVKYLAWDLAHRDTNKNALLEWHIESSPTCRSGESGLDNSQRFDAATQMDAVDFSVFAAHDMQHLALIARALKKPALARTWITKAHRTRAAVLKKLFDPATGFFYDAHLTGGLSPVKAVTGFLPLLFDGLPAARVDALVAMLKNPAHFATPVPIPSIAISQPDWSTDMWRGSTWINMNYLIVLGLRKHGRLAEAAALKSATLAFVRKYYEQLGVLFEFYDAKDLLPPTLLDRKGPHVEPYDVRRKYDSIRDYHWTAALTFCLLLEDTTAPAPEKRAP